MATAKYSDWTHGQEEALKNILGGDEICRKILAGTVKVTLEEVFSTQVEQLGEMKIVVDYDLSLQEMIAAGQYDLVNDDITPERFPVIGKGVMQLISQLVHFNRNISSDDAEKELDKKGLRPATLAELLAFGKTYPEVQRKFPVVALGSVARIYGNRYVTYLDGSDSKRHLDLGCRGIDWPARFRFLAFPK